MAAEAVCQPNCSKQQAVEESGPHYRVMRPQRLIWQKCLHLMALGMCDCCGRAQKPLEYAQTKPLIMVQLRGAGGICNERGNLMPSVCYPDDSEFNIPAPSFCCRQQHCPRGLFRIQTQDGSRDPQRSVFRCLYQQVFSPSPQHAGSSYTHEAGKSQQQQ